MLQCYLSRVNYLIVAMLLGLQANSAQATTIYDGSLGTTPNAQGWTYFPDNGTFPFPPVSVTMDTAPGGTLLQTLSPNTDRAGFFRTDITQDRNVGYTLRFNLRIDGHDVNAGNNDRAGFNVIALSNDLQGIELAFWNDRVFAQADSPLFTHAEEALVNTALLREYELTIQGSSYSLSWTGGTLLSGPLRNYSSHSNPVYSTANFFFLGDNTTSAGADIYLGNIEFQAIPEPGAWAMGILLLVGFGTVKIRRSSHRA
jgi:hypothetical protein